MANELVHLGVLLAFAGIAIIMVALFLMFSKRGGEGRVQGGGAVLIGPIPVVWGTDKRWIFVAIALLLIITLVNFVMPLLVRL
ncbi:MAG: DUF131 domain-containing protein [Thaumarchaeota archaeon]|nr:DUF131 domain-containing protein [Nitrososphaerota archaeon]